jgi:hypothetical protein
MFCYAVVTYIKQFYSHHHELTNTPLRNFIAHKHLYEVAFRSILLPITIGFRINTT